MKNSLIVQSASLLTRKISLFRCVGNLAGNDVNLLMLRAIKNSQVAVKFPVNSLLTGKFEAGSYQRDGANPVHGVAPPLLRPSAVASRFGRWWWSRYAGRGLLLADVVLGKVFDANASGTRQLGGALA